MASAWYFVAPDGRQIGPVSSEELRNLAQAQRIQPQTPVWREGLANWVEAAQVEG
ncbi:MAG: DUF4339 domain-containing protein, partial [Planctomycetaceae bacterium]|nr:DUF4339 domain-containing protein [Planctomycetaceae bacterium]